MTNSSGIIEYFVNDNNLNNSTNNSWLALDQHFDNVTLQSQAEHWLQTGAVHMLATHGATMPTTLTSPGGFESTTMSYYKESLADDPLEHSAQSRVVAADHDQQHDHTKHNVDVSGGGGGGSQQQVYNHGHHHHQHDGSMRGLVRNGDESGVNVANDHHMPMIFHARVEEVILFEFWHTKEVWHMLLSCLIIILLGIFYEGIKFYREWLFKQRASRANNQNNNKGNTKKPTTVQWNDRSAGGGGGGGSGNFPTPMFDAYTTSRRITGGAILPQVSQQSQQSGQSQQTAQSQRSILTQPSQQTQPSLLRWMQTASLAASREGEVERALSPRRETDICSKLHFAQTFLHLLQVALGFMLMLIFMTFNVWLCTSVVIGAGIGYFVFFWRLQRINLEHCI